MGNNGDKNLSVNNETTIKIKAFDTLFFRDGKPFSRGEETWADGIFPPSPSVIYGALRGCYFSRHINKLRFANKGKDDPTCNVQITGISLKPENDTDIFFPLPLDCISKKDDSENKAFIIYPKKLPVDMGCHSKLEMIVIHDTDEKTLADGLISYTHFTHYLGGETGEFPIQRIKDIILREPKVGIGRTNSTHAVKESMLYRVGMQRIMASLIVTFRGLEIPRFGMMKLGGEGKAVHYSTIDVVPDVPDISITKGFKLILTTPAIFKHGWLPCWIDPLSLTGEFNTIQVKLVAAIIGKPLYIGGFDLRAGKPKPMRKAVPPGSVYYFRIINGPASILSNIPKRVLISDYLKNEGYGIAYIGRMKG